MGKSKKLTWVITTRDRRDIPGIRIVVEGARIEINGRGDVMVYGPGVYSPVRYAFCAGSWVRLEQNDE